VGPWTHATFADPIGEEVFGVRAARFGAPSHRQGDANDLQLAWFRHHLAEDRTVDLSSAPVRIFVMGRNVWRDETSWPLARAKQGRWFFHADGSLSPIQPTSDEVASRFHHDSAASSADWIVRLCDVHPDGRSLNLCDGILRAGRAERHEIDLWSTSNVFLRGHRLRVHVTGSCFPRWDNQPNSADQTIHHDSSRPSYIELPVV